MSAMRIPPHPGNSALAQRGRAALAARTSGQLQAQGHAVDMPWTARPLAMLVYLNRRINMLPVYALACALVCLQLASRKRLRTPAF